MRDYSKVVPKMWHGKTMKALRKSPEGLVVALYLMTSPSSNMLGLYSQPVLYMAHETGLGEEGAKKGLQRCIEAGFCSYDEESEFVFVHEMASYQIASELKVTDLRCKGIQKEYDQLADNPFLSAFFQRYVSDFHLTNERGAQAPCKPLPSQEQEQEQEQEQDKDRPNGLVGKADDSGDKKASKDSDKPGLPYCQVQKVVDLYHEVLPELPKAKLLNDGRRKAIGKTWKWVLTTAKTDGQPRATTAAEALEWFKQYFTIARGNDFLMGRTTRTGEHANWQCDLDFLLTDRGMKHVIEKTQKAAA